MDQQREYGSRWSVEVLSTPAVTESCEWGTRRPAYYSFRVMNGGVFRAIKNLSGLADQDGRF